MRLVTHNLMCCVKCQAHPLSIRCEELTPADTTYSADLVRRMLARLDYGYLKAAYLSLRAQQPSVLSTAPAIPDSVEALEGQGDDSALLRAVHFALCGIAVKKGALVCDACKTEYPIADYIPNTMINNN